MTQTSLSTPVLKAIADPLIIMGASWKATATNACLAVLAVLFLGSVWSILASFVVFQSLAIYYTYRDCHFVEVIMAVFKCRQTSTLIHQPGHQVGHRYVS